MPLRQSGSLTFFEFESLSGAGLSQAIFTRRGGVSSAPWDSLNTGASVGDDPQSVLENRRRIFAAAGQEFDSIFDVWQVHEAKVVHARAPRAGQPIIQADAMITDNPEVSLFMRFADCVPIFLHDPVQRAVGLVHAGWLGTVRKAVKVAVQEMVSCFGCNPEDILAGIGPSIAQHHYPVGPEVVERVRQAFGGQAGEHLALVNGREHFDLWSANRFLLQEQGVRRIETSQACTACDTETWYSHRAENGRTGRFGALLALRDRSAR